MNPRDCLRSRLSIVNRLHREDEHSVNQASASVRVLTHFLHDLLDAGDTTYAQEILHELQFVIRDEHLGKSTHRKLLAGSRRALPGVDRETRARLMGAFDASRIV